MALVKRFGDTTNASAQVRALDRLRIEAPCRTDGCIAQLIAQLCLGFSIPATRQVIMPDPYGWMVKGVGSGGLPY